MYIYSGIQVQTQQQFTKHYCLGESQNKQNSKLCAGYLDQRHDLMHLKGSSVAYILKGAFNCKIEAKKVLSKSSKQLQAYRLRHVWILVSATMPSFWEEILQSNYLFFFFFFYQYLFVLN